MTARRLVMLLSLLLLSGCAGGRPPVRRSAPADPPDPSSRMPFLPSNPATMRPRVNDPKPFNPDLHALRARTGAPYYYDDLTVASLLDFVPRAFRQAGLNRRDRWRPAAQDEVAQWEGRGAALEGYLTAVKFRGGNMVLLLAEWPDDPPSRTAFAQVSRDTLNLHPKWTADRFRRLARGRPRFRVSGWLLWDNSRATEAGRTRGTLWEVNPVLKIEVWDGRDWWEPG